MGIKKDITPVSLFGKKIRKPKREIEKKILSWRRA